MTQIVQVKPADYGSANSRRILEIAAACAATDGTSPLDEDATIHIHHHGLTASSLWMHPHGFALLRKPASVTHFAPPTAPARLDLAVKPAARGNGVGASLMAEVLSASTSDAPATLVTWSHADLPAAVALARRTGFTRIRELHELARPLPLPANPQERTRVRAMRPGDETVLLRINAAAFAAHPEQGGLSAHDLALRMAEPWFSPSGLLLAEDEAGDVLGFHWTKVHPNRTGEVYVLGVAPWAQGRGVGKALLVAGLAHLHNQGCTEARLFVDAANKAAVTLYRGLGFDTTRTHAQYQRSPAAHG